MKIAQIAPIIESVPPKLYGGTERIISVLTEELIKRGHEVTLFASGDSITQAKLMSVYPVSLREAKSEGMYGGCNIWSLLNVGMAYQEQKKFDIIHDHNSQNNPVSLPLANLSKTPVVMTLHGPLTNGYAKPYTFYKKPHLVTISKKQAFPAPDLNYIGNVYHGLHMNDYPFSKKHDGFLLYVGRIHIENGIEEKGVLHAIEVAKMLDMPLFIAAKVDEHNKDDVSYFKEVVKPLLTDKIQFFGEVDEDMRNELMSKAYCLLHPINFAEPFGLTLIEAMACGAPIVAFDKGSIPEIVAHGKTGFVVNDIYSMAKAVKKVGSIKRAECREYALKTFSVERMTDGYEAIYQKLLDKKTTKSISRTIMTKSRKEENNIPLYAKPTLGKFIDM